MGNLTEPRGLAVDWVGQLVYWVDAGMHTLSVASLDGKLRRTLISQHLDQPNDLAVDPHSRSVAPASLRAADVDPTRRLVYWCDFIA